MKLERVPRERVRQIVALIVAAYPSWGATKDTLDLYVHELSNLDVGAVEKAVMEYIRLPEKFAPSLGQIYTRAQQIEHENKERLSWKDRLYEPGEVRCTPSGIYMQADANGKMHPIPGPPQHTTRSQTQLNTGQS